MNKRNSVRGGVIYLKPLNNKGKVSIKTFTLLILFSLILIAFSTSFAYQKFNLLTGESKITTDDVSIEYLESDTGIINLENALPMSDTDGKAQDNTFDFVVKTKTSKTLDIGYNLVIEKLEPSSGYSFLNDEDINVYLTDSNNNELVFKNIGDINKDYVLYTKTNNHNSTNKEIKDKYKLRVWVDKNVLTNDWNENTKLEYKFKIGVKTSVKETDTEESYIVKYNANKGTGNIESSTFKQGESKKLNKNTFTREGYTFIGWSTSSNSKEVVYKDEQEVKNLTNVYNGVVNLYAVWEGNTYKIRYNSNGGGISTNIDFDVTYDPMNFNTSETRWTYENGIYKSAKVEQGTQSYLMKMLTLEETSDLSIEIAVAHDDALTVGVASPDLKTIYFQDTAPGDSTITSEENVKYSKISGVTLPAGTYIVGFIYKGQGTGFDRAYIKNIKATSSSGQMKNSSFKVGDKNKLSKNEYEKEGYIFKGWSTTLNGEVKYKDEEEIKDLTLEKDKVIDLYAVWEKEKYKVNVVVQNGTLLDGEVPSKEIEYNSNGTFNLYTSKEYYSGLVICTNNQKGTFESGVLTVSNVTSDTTCTVSYVTEKTTLYTDGTLIINEQLKNRNANIEKHGEVTNEYEAMSASNSYVFTYYNDAVNSPWFTEREQVKSVEIGKIIQPISTANWFHELGNMEKGDFTNLDTSNVTDMYEMFWHAGENATTWSIGDLSNWDTSKVTDMHYMFLDAGKNATTWSIGDLSNWNTSNVTDMSSMFYEAGANARTWNIGDLSNWDTSNVTNMNGMFWHAGENATTWSIGDLSNWNTSNVTNMSSMFSSAGSKATTWNIGDLSNWDTSKVIDMSRMFLEAGRNPTTWNIGNLSSWGTSKVTDMGGMFYYAGQNATTWSIGDLSTWDTSKVTDMGGMFNNAGSKATTWSIGDLSSWNTSNVTSMSSMFSYAGSKATTWSIGDLSNWNTSNVTNMWGMFSGAGQNATTWSIGDLSAWDTSQVTSMGDMFYAASQKATTFNLDLSNWDTSKVTKMGGMFNNAGSKATTFNLNLSNWNTSKVTKMGSMFNGAGENATTWLVKIPSTTGSLTNTTSKWYGSSESVYAEPRSGKSFTLS